MFNSWTDNVDCLFEDLYENLALKLKLFADDTPLFSVMKYTDDPCLGLSHNLKRISELAF